MGRNTPPMSDSDRKAKERRRGELVGLIQSAVRSGDTRVAEKFTREMERIASDLAVDDARRGGR
jgi:hypothetical protein